MDAGTDHLFKADSVLNSTKPVRESVVFKSKGDLITLPLRMPAFLLVVVIVGFRMFGSRVFEVRGHQSRIS